MHSQKTQEWPSPTHTRSSAGATDAWDGGALWAGADGAGGDAQRHRAGLGILSPLPSGDPESPRSVSRCVPQPMSGSGMQRWHRPNTPEAVTPVPKAY